MYSRFSAYTGQGVCYPSADEPRLQTTAPSKDCLANFEEAGGWTTSAGTGLILVFAYSSDAEEGEVQCRELTTAEYTALFTTGPLPVPLSTSNGASWYVDPSVCTRCIALCL